MFMTLTEVPRVEWKKQPNHYMAVYRGNTVFIQSYRSTGENNKIQIIL